MDDEMIYASALIKILMGGKLWFKPEKININK
jgi:hypothetical protein